ncbi:MAG TPA: EAL domain-containing protein [Longimicrobium sp.]|jgi:EAL domain-containing protein (putative c-di-GMP-specific phosphodiesterase class I)|uniref:EAL domain-containing protein n=1 Tax=Longimicrobium sp. TaxID=2029185 RepID=UPI002EDAC32E
MTLSSTDHSLPCECRTDARSLVVMAPGLERYPELRGLTPGEDWVVHPALGAVRVEVGSGSRWSGVAEVAAFLRTELDAERFGALRAAWAQRGAPLEEQLVTLLHAERLADMVQVDSSQLTAMLAERRVETWYQPIFWAGTLELWGYECLMRGRAVDGSLVSPATLLEWARQEHLAFLLDRHVREMHLRNAGAAGLGPPHHLLINFLPTAIYRPEFCLRTTVRAVAESGLEPDHVVFEVVETEHVPRREHLRDLLAFYRNTGFKVALDDVGSGFSGLSLLADLNPDLIKIDRELVSRSVEGGLHRDVCESLARLGQQNGQMVLAEGVETEAEWRVMTELGVNLLQGYLFGRPDPVPAREARVRAVERTPMRTPLASRA